MINSLLKTTVNTASLIAIRQCWRVDDDAVASARNLKEGHFLTRKSNCWKYPLGVMVQLASKYAIANVTASMMLQRLQIFLKELIVVAHVSAHFQSEISEIIEY